MIQLARFSTEPQCESWGIVREDRILDLGTYFPGVATMLDVIRDWNPIHNRLHGEIQNVPSRPLNSVQLLSPVPESGKTICIGLNYRDHAIESGMDIPSEPIVFNKWSGTVCGPDVDVPLPGVSQQVDYEAELVMVIGRTARYVDEAQAMDHVFGYTCGHDVSARDWQIGRPGGQWLLGKSFPNFAPIGPYLIPASEIGDPNNLRISMRLNGETVQDSSTRQLIFNPAELICHLSKCCELQPGDLIFTGTPPGVGMAAKPPRFLRDGDVCEVDIERVGVLRNRFVGVPK